MPPAITVPLEHRVPTSRVVAALGSSRLQSPPGRYCSTSTAPSPLGSTGTELDRRRRRQARRCGSDRRPHQRGREGFPTRLGGTPRPPIVLLVAPTCQTRVRGYSTAQRRNCPARRSRCSRESVCSEPRLPADPETPLSATAPAMAEHAAHVPGPFGSKRCRYRSISASGNPGQGSTAHARGMLDVHRERPPRLWPRRAHLAPQRT